MKPVTLRACAAAWFGIAMLSCGFDKAYRDVTATVQPSEAPCASGVKECREGRVAECVTNAASAPAWQVIDDCPATAAICTATPTPHCALCEPGSARCSGQQVETCNALGSAYTATRTCDAAVGESCRGGGCVNLCRIAIKERSNVGCEYWAVDLDNAVISASLNAAAQQFAVVVSNVQSDIATTVKVEEDTSLPGETPSPRTVQTTTIGPKGLEVFKLGPREVDGSKDGAFNEGTGTALTRHAYRVTSSQPIVAYQFNPLENVNVFSNDASQLLPISALDVGKGRGYVVASWPQTIALSTVPTENFGQHLRAFLTVVGTQANTHVHVRTRARIVPGSPVPQGVAANAEADATLGAFDVLNLETGDFNADFTGSLVDSDKPVAVFTGAEAADAPFFSKLSDRFCCADHLEEQVTPVRALGKRYVLARSPSRTKAVAAAGGTIGMADEPEYFRIVSADPGTTTVATTLPPPDNFLQLAGEGDMRTVVAHRDFALQADKPVIVSQTQASQEAAGVPRTLPGGDPSLVFVPPVEQWRDDYVLLTPDKYAFDFVILTAPKQARLFIDGFPVTFELCESAEISVSEASDAWVAYRCQLSFPSVDPMQTAPLNLKPGRQNDGVHHLQADRPFGVLVYGFDAFVSYAYAGGTQLAEIQLQ